MYARGAAPWEVWKNPASPLAVREQAKLLENTAHLYQERVT
jgi:hypothetical protein